MNYKRFIAAAMAICLSCGAIALNSECSCVPGDVSAADESSSNDITLKNIGDTIPVTLSGTTQTPVWYSDDESVATVKVTDTLTAEITAAGKGTTSVYASVAGKLIRFNVTVTGGSSSDEKQTIYVGKFTLTNAQNGASAALDGVDNKEAVWSTSDAAVAVVDDEGNITAVGKGECQITAVRGNTTYIVDIVSEYDPALSTDPAENYICTLELSNAAPSRKLSFTVPEGTIINLSSTDESVAVVSSDGTVTARGSGECRIYAEINGSKSYAVIISTYDPDSEEGSPIGSITLTDASPSKKLDLENIPDGAEIEWSSSDTSVATVDSSGTITGQSSGTCEVYAYINGVKYIVSVTVSFGSESMTETEIKGIGNTITLSSQSMDGEITYTSSDTSVAVVDSKGVVTATGLGTAVITADNGSVKAQIRIKVTAGAGLIGDANLDGKVSIADAVAILQSIGNRDKYALSEQGLLNADVDGVKGVTAKDALVIQKFEAKLINSLPLAPQ